MLQSSSEKKTSMLFLSRISPVLRKRFILLLTLLLLLPGVLTWAVAAIYLSDALLDGSPYPSAQPVTCLICLCVVTGGILLLLAGWRFSSLHLTFWQILLVGIGALIGLGLSWQHMAYRAICCMFGYQLGYGYPFTAVQLSIVSDNPLSWKQVFTLLQQHSDQFYQQLAGHAIMANMTFYGYIALIIVVVMRSCFILSMSFARKKTSNI